MKTLARILLTVVVLFGCHKDNQAPVDEGLYNEISPDPGRAQLKFISTTQVIVWGPQLLSGLNLQVDTAEYRSSDGRIALTNLSSNSHDTSIYWVYFVGSDSLQLTSCPPGLFCPLAQLYLMFKK